MPIVYAAVKALISVEGKFLLLQQDVGGEIFWDIPGGRVQFGESPLDGLKREAREELGQEIEIGRSLGVWWFFRKVDGDQVVCSTFLCTIRDPAFTLPSAHPSDERIAGMAWVTKEQLVLPEYASVPPSLRTLIEAA